MSFAEGFAVGAQAKLSRDRLNEEVKARNQELVKAGYAFDDKGGMSIRPNSQAEGEQLQALEAVQLAKSLQGKLAAMGSDKAMVDYAHTGEASYLNDALNNDPLLKKSWGERGVQLIGDIDFGNDHNLLANAGLQPSHYDTPDKQSILRKNMYKINNGKDWSIGLLNNAAMETGTLTRLGQREGGVITQNYEEFNSLLKGPRVDPNTAEGHKYESEINAAAEKYDLPPNLIASMMHTESSGNPNAVSPKGAAGLMQLMPGTAAELGVTDVSNPAQNIDAGAKYFKQQLDKYGDVPMALAAYNAGPGNVDKYGGIPPFGETQNYVSKIMGNLDRGEKYYSRTADTIIDHYRSIANAKQGTTNANVDQKVANETRGVDQTDRQLDQKDTELGTKLLEIQTKLKTDGTTATQKDLNEAAVTTDTMLNEFGGEDQFLKTDFSDPKNFNKAYRSMVKIEKLEGTTLSEKDKTSITETRQLLSLGDAVGELSEAQTGIIDQKLNNTKKYLLEDVGGTAATSAYYTIRNSVRRALSGQALTDSEIKSFNEAFGSLGQKAGPALTQLKTSLGQVKAGIESTQNLMNPYSAHIRLGKDATKINQILETLDKNIAYAEGLTPKQTAAKTNRTPLESIFGGGTGGTKKFGGNSQ